MTTPQLNDEGLFYERLGIDRLLEAHVPGDTRLRVSPGGGVGCGDPQPGGVSCLVQPGFGGEAQARQPLLQQRAATTGYECGNAGDDRGRIRTDANAELGRLAAGVPAGRFVEISGEECGRLRAPGGVGGRIG